MNEAAKDIKKQAKQKETEEKKLKEELAE